MKRFLVKIIITLISMVMLLDGFSLVIAAGDDNEKTAKAKKSIQKKGNIEKGKKTYTLYCASCHGKTGKGDGAAAIALNPKPRDLNDSTFMKNLANEYISKIVKNGGVAVGKSPLMPPVGAAFSDETLKNLIAFMRSLSDKETKKATTANKK